MRPWSIICPFVLISFCGGCVYIPLPAPPPASNTSPLIGRIGAAGSGKPVSPGIHRDAIPALAGHPDYADKRGVTEVYHYVEDRGSWLLIGCGHRGGAEILPMFRSVHWLCIQYRRDGTADSIDDLDYDQFDKEEKRRRKVGDELISFDDLQKTWSPTTAQNVPSTVPVR
jgi:hypothetical protein